MKDIDLKAIDAALAPGRVFQQQLDQIFEPQRRLQERLDQILEPQRRLQERLERAMEPQRRFQRQLDQVLAPYQAIQDQFERVLEPQRRLQEQLESTFSTIGTVREQIDRAFASENRLQMQLEDAFRPYRMIQGSFDRYLSPLENYLNDVTTSNIEIGDDGALIVAGETVTSDEIDDVIVDLPRKNTDPEEFYAQLFQKLQTVSANVGRAVVYLLITYLLSIIANLTTPIYQEWWKELSGVQPKDAKQEIIGSARNLYSSEELVGYRFVYATTLHVRKSGNRNAEIIDELYLGTVVRVVEKSRRWTYVEYYDSVAGENKQGWVFTRYIRTFK